MLRRSRYVTKVRVVLKARIAKNVSKEWKIRKPCLSVCLLTVEISRSKSNTNWLFLILKP